MLAFTVFAAVGGAEMVMSSIGSMVVSLRANVPTSILDEDDKIRLGRETLALRAQQVKYLAVANTLARLLVGIVSDQLSPRPSANRSEARRRQEAFQISRVTMLIGGLALLFVSYIYAAAFLDKVEHLWIVSIATGTGYGLTFTLVPSMVVVLWPKQFGRNYGLLTYAAAVGSLCFSILFAQINDLVANRNVTVPDLTEPPSQPPISVPGASICVYGRACFASSFALAAATVGIAMFVALPLWRAWRTHL
jgi:MFS family permease